MSQLFTPFECRDVTARNRVVVSPMCQYSSTGGAPGDWQMAVFGRYALGGAGIVFGEETAISPEGRKTHDCAGLWSEEQVPAFRRLTDFIRAQGGVPAIQIGHSGRKGAVHGARQGWAPMQPHEDAPGRPVWCPMAPSPVPISEAHQTPREMTAADIASVVQDFAAAARLADKAGYDILEIHGAHGYLIHQFLSPLTNRRGDEYGGARLNRMRFALEVAEAVRAAWPAGKPLFYRASCVDGQGGIWDLEDTIALARELGSLGVDVLDCSSGGMAGRSDMDPVRRVPGYHVEFSARIRAEAGIQTMAVGLITEPDQAEAILVNGQADLVALARELMWNPNWPAHAARDLGVEDAYGLMPEEIAYRLRRRDAVAEMEINRP